MKTQLSEPARTKARYTEEYKQEALELWHSSAATLPMGALEARTQRGQKRAQSWRQRQRTRSEDPAPTCRERQAFGAT